MGRSKKVTVDRPQTTERIFSLDVIRSLAIVMVVLNHAVESIYRLNLKDMATIGLNSRIFAFSAFTLGRCGVPLFLLLTGYLVLSREYDANGAERFWKNNFLRLVITWEIWIFIYNIFLTYFRHSRSFDFAMYLSNSLFLRHTELSHTWYVPMIIGMYFFLPLVSRIIHDLNVKVLCGLMTSVFIYFYLVPNYSILSDIYKWRRLGGQIDFSFSGGVYGFYLILGYLLSKYQLHIKEFLKRRYIFVVCIVLAALAFAISVYSQFFAYAHMRQYNIWYNFFTLPILGALIFSLAIYSFNDYHTPPHIAKIV